jgi:hypothetical protein
MVRFRLIRLIRLTRCAARIFHAPDLLRLPDFWQRRGTIFPCSGQNPAIAQGAGAMIRPSLHGAGCRFTAAHPLSAVIGSLSATDKQHDAVELLFRRHCLNKGVYAKMDAFRAVCKGL